jgi:hypothetical protein
MYTYKFEEKSMDGYLSQLVIGAIILSQFFGCGGGSSDSDDPTINSNDGPFVENDQQNSNYNGDLTGWLFFSDSSKYLDLSSGNFTMINWDYQHEFITPSADGTEYVLWYKDNSSADDPGCPAPQNRVEQKNSQDLPAYSFTNTFEKYKNYVGSIKLSLEPDSVFQNEVDRINIINMHTNFIIDSFEKFGDFRGPPSYHPMELWLR